MSRDRHPSFLTNPAIFFAVLLLLLLASHAGLLRLPYFWDEAGYYIPAARDLLQHGSLIPHSTVSNAHPPLVMAWLALFWRLFGSAPLVTRSAMLLVAAFSLLGVFQLARRIANLEVALASTVCTAVYPVFFAQSSLAQVDLAAAGLVFWGLCSYVAQRQERAAIWFSLAVIAKETALLVPLALFLWEILPVSRRLAESLEAIEQIGVGSPTIVHDRWQRRWHAAVLLIPAVPLGLWYVFHYLKTGYVFGNPEYFRYNVEATQHPLRVFLALLMRLWQTFGYMGLWLLTAAAVLAMLSPARLECPGPAGQEASGPSEPTAGESGLRPRIAVHIQFAFLTIIALYVLAMSLVGGAVLARYMLPVVPLVIILAVSTLRRRVQWWGAVVAIIAAVFCVNLFVNPPYGFSLEDNLAYRDYILLHQQAETFLEARFPNARVLTAWPASDEITRPALGYVSRPLRAIRIEDFTADQLLSAAEFQSRAEAHAGYDVALVFSTKYDPPNPILESSRYAQSWSAIKSRFFGYHVDLPPPLAARILQGDIIYSQYRKGQWIAVIETRAAAEAQVTTRR